MIRISSARRAKDNDEVNRFVCGEFELKGETLLLSTVRGGPIERTPNDWTKTLRRW